MTVRAPHFSKPLLRRVQPPQVLASLLVTTLAVPFAQYDWPNPKESGWQETLTVSRSITEVPSAPFRQTDWPNPEPLQTTQLEQISKSIALVEAAVEEPFKQIEWISPEPLLIQQQDQVGTLLPLIFTEPEPPFLEFDWPNPAPFERQTPHQVGTLLPLIFTEPEPPFMETKWPVPDPLPTQEPVQVNMPLAIFEDAGEKPFVQSDWITPPAFERQIPFQVGSPYILLETPPPPKPFHQDDWVNPEPLPTQTPEQVNKSVALVEPVAEDPFRQTDWPNPIQLGFVAPDNKQLDLFELGTSATDNQVIFESEIVAGGEVITLTLTGDAWVSAGTEFNNQRQNIIEGMSADFQPQANGWNAEVRDKEDVGAVVRVSDTVVEITLTASPSYAITSSESVTITIPATALVNGIEIISTPTVTTNDEKVNALYDWPNPILPVFVQPHIQSFNLLTLGSAELSLASKFESAIVSPGATTFIDLIGDTWVADGPTFDAQRQNIIDGMVSFQSETFGWNNEVRAKEDPSAITRNTDTRVQVTLTGAPQYRITADEFIVFTIPATALVNGIELLATPNYQVVNQDIPFFQTDWPNPGPFARQTPFQVGMPLAILEDAGEKPFKFDDWPQPEPLPTQEPIQVNKSIALVEAPPSEPAFFQTDWPNPEPLPTVQVEQVSKSIALVEPEVIDILRTYDWPLPRTPGWQDTLTTSRGITDDLPPPTPFAQHDWPNPTLKVIEILHETGVSPIEPGDPFSLLDWPNPTVLPEVQTPFQVGSPYALIGDTGEKPFDQLDWPNPQVFTRPIPEYRGSVLPKAIGPPFIQLIGLTNQNPQLPVEVQQPFQVGSPLTLLEDAGEKPFTQDVWPIPTVVERRQEPLQVNKSIVFVEIFEPFKQLDWPNPTLAVLVQPPQQKHSELSLIEFAGAIPFVQIDWIKPLPTQIQTPVQLSKSDALVEPTFPQEGFRDVWSSL